MSTFNIDSEYLGLRDQDLWVFYDETDKVLTELTFGAIAPEATVTKTIKARYRGHSPIQIAGFYLADIDKPFYDGTNLLDKETLIEWADLYTGDQELPGVPGMEIQFVDGASDSTIIKQVKSGQGDTEATPIPYTGYENSILRTDDRIDLVLRITAPTNSQLLSLSKMKFHFGLEISFIELPENITQQMIGDRC